MKKKITAFRGFTLIELLVTMGIIAILATLVTMVAANVKAAADSPKCAAHMRQVFTAMRSYLVDNGNILPQRFDGETGYHQLLQPYTEGESKIFTCPTHKAASYPVEPSYGMNWYYDNQPMTRIEDPAQTILLAETLGVSGGGSNRADRDSITPGNLDKGRHKGKANYLFADGHLAAMEYEATRREIAKNPETGDPIDLWGIDWGEHDKQDDEGEEG